MEKLKSCPFCGKSGKKLIIIKNGCGWKSGVGCGYCELNIYFFKEGINVNHYPEGSAGSAEAIIKAWNRRVK